MERAFNFSPSRSSHIDLLRGLAILGVVIVHTQACSNTFLASKGESQTLLAYVASLGQYGVELFFVISGFLLASLYPETKRFSGVSFFIRRIVRIYPLWVLFLGVALLRNFFDLGGGVSKAHESLAQSSSEPISWIFMMIATLTFTLWLSASLWNTVIPGGWSIQAEVAHYLLFPFLRSRKLNDILWVSIGVNLVTTFLYMTFPKPQAPHSLGASAVESWIRLGLYSTFGYFFIGYIAAQFVHQHSSDFDMNRAFTLTLPKPELFAFWLLSFLLVPLSFGNQIEAIGFVSLMVISSLGLTKVPSLKRILTLLGKYSYFIYFVHFLVLELITWILSKTGLSVDFLGDELIVFALILITTLVISILLALPSYKYFESPFINFGHRI